MNGKQAKKLRAAAKLYMTSVAAPVQQAELRISKKNPVQTVLIDGKPMEFPRAPSLISYWPAGSERRAYNNIKRAWQDGRYTERKVA